MNLQAEKLEVMRLVLETDDKSILGEVKALFKSRGKSKSKENALDEFYENFRQGIREVKSSVDGKNELKDAETWLNELHD